MLDLMAAILVFLGSIFITLLGVAVSYATSEEHTIRLKSVARDFIIGLGLSGTAYYFVPDSFDSIGKTLQGISLPELSGDKGGVMPGGWSSSGGRSSVGDLNIHVGPVNF